MGVRSIQIHNQTLLDKWFWRFGKDKESLLRRVIVAKYDTSVWKPKRAHEGHGCGFWKFILHEADFFGRTFILALGRVRRLVYGRIFGSGIILCWRILGISISWLSIRRDLFLRTLISVTVVVIRDHDHNLIQVTCGPLGECNAIHAKVNSLLMGLREIKCIKLKGCEVEGDSAVIISWGKGTCLNSWELASTIYEIRELLSLLFISLIHIDMS